MSEKGESRFETLKEPFERDGVSNALGLFGCLNWLGFTESDENTGRILERTIEATYSGLIRTVNYQEHR